MPLFEYQAKDGPVKVVKGTIEADSEAAAIAALSQQGVIPVSLRVVAGPAPAMVKRTGRVSKRSLYTVTYQLAELLTSGLSLHKALATIVSQEQSSRIGEVMADVAARMRDGAAFSQSLSAHDRVFDQLYVNMVRVGEASGKLDTVLEHLAVMYEKEHDFSSKIVQALTYPAFIAVCGVGTMFAILAFVIPRLEAMYADMGKALPFITQVVIAVSLVVRKTWLLGAVMVAAGLMVVQQQMRSATTRSRLFDIAAHYIPLWGALLVKEELARAARVCALTLESGVPILDVLQLTGATVRSLTMRDAFDRVRTLVEQGSALNDALRRERCFPAFLVNVVATGEESGTLPAALNRLATMTEKEVERYLKVVSTLIEPLLVLFIGIFVGIVVISMLLPIFQINVFVK